MLSLAWWNGIPEICGCPRFLGFTFDPRKLQRERMDGLKKDAGYPSPITTSTGLHSSLLPLAYQSVFHRERGGVHWQGLASRSINNSEGLINTSVI